MYRQKYFIYEDLFHFTDTIECEDCVIIMDELESIDDDAHRAGISFVKTTDLEIAKRYGIKITPALVYYENDVPSIYEGK